MKRKDNPITKKEAIELIKSFLDETIAKEEWYLKISDQIKAVILYGSVARGENKIDSDIDVLFIIPLEAEEKYTTGEYFYNYGGYEINVVLRSIEKLRVIAEEGTDKVQKEIFSSAEILFDLDGEVSKLLTQIALIG